MSLCPYSPDADFVVTARLLSPAAAGLVDMDMAAMTSSLAASPRAHLLSASYSPLKAVALRGGAAASGWCFLCRA
jgi:hypothetical protein